MYSNERLHQIQTARSAKGTSNLVRIWRRTYTPSQPHDRQSAFRSVPETLPMKSSFSRCRKGSHREWRPQPIHKARSIYIGPSLCARVICCEATSPAATNTVRLVASGGRGGWSPELENSRTTRCKTMASHWPPERLPLGGPLCPEGVSIYWERSIPGEVVRRIGERQRRMGIKQSSDQTVPLTFAVFCSMGPVRLRKHGEYLECRYRFQKSSRSGGQLRLTLPAAHTYNLICSSRSPNTCCARAAGSDLRPQSDRSGRQGQGGMFWEHRSRVTPTGR
jgi:hypothetical protein